MHLHTLGHKYIQATLGAGKAFLVGHCWLASEDSVYPSQFMGFGQFQLQHEIKGGNSEVFNMPVRLLSVIEDICQIETGI